MQAGGVQDRAGPSAGVDTGENKMLLENAKTMEKRLFVE
jgi:hypothetical protein